MKLEHYPVVMLKKDIIEILKKYLDLAHYHVFFFGSRSSGNGTDRSDIDVGVDGPRIPTNTWLIIREEFENFPLLYKIEIVDFNRVSPRFREVALQQTEDIVHAHHEKIPSTV